MRWQGRRESDNVEDRRYDEGGYNDGRRAGAASACRSPAARARSALATRLQTGLEHVTVIACAQHRSADAGSCKAHMPFKIPDSASGVSGMTLGTVQPVPGLPGPSPTRMLS